MKVSKSGYCEYVRRRKLNAQIERESLEGFARDVFSRKAVGWSMSNRITEKLATHTIEQAVGREPLPRATGASRAMTTARMSPAGFAASGTEPYLAVGTASQHPDPHSD